MSLSEKSRNDVVKALSAGELTMDELIADIPTEHSYLRRGKTYSLLTREGTSYIAGVGFVHAYSVETKRIDNNGEEVVRQSRNGDDGE